MKSGKKLVMKRGMKGGMKRDMNRGMTLLDKRHSDWLVDGQEHTQMNFDCPH